MRCGPQSRGQTEPARGIGPGTTRSRTVSSRRTNRCRAGSVLLQTVGRYQQEEGGPAARWPRLGRDAWCQAGPRRSPRNGGLILFNNQKSVCAKVTKEVAGRDDLQRSISGKQDDFQRKKIATVIGDQEMGAAFDARRNDRPVLEIARDLLQVLVVTGDEFAYVS